MKGVWIAGGVSLALVTVLAIAGQPAVDNSPKARLQRIKDECEETYGVNSSQSVDCFFIALAERMAAERTGSHPATRLAVVQ